MRLDAIISCHVSLHLYPVFAPPFMPHMPTPKLHTAFSPLTPIPS